MRLHCNSTKRKIRFLAVVVFIVILTKMLVESLQDHTLHKEHLTTDNSETYLHKGDFASGTPSTSVPSPTWLSATESLTDRESWVRGLDVSFPYTAFYQNISRYIHQHGSFPWHMVKNNSLFANTDLDDYVEHYCVNGTPFAPLRDYRNPCWYASPSPTNSTSGDDRRRDVQLTCMPFFYLAGFPRAGTTDLYKHLQLHPKIVVSGPKEKQYWNNKRGHFRRYVQKFREVGQALRSGGVSGPLQDGITLDADPAVVWRKSGYSQQYLSALTLRALQPEVKIVLMLRNPTERTISHFRRFGDDSPFYLERHVARRVPKLKTCIEEFGVFHCAFNPQLYQDDRKIDIRASLYYVYVKIWLDIFPKSQILALKSEDYFTNKLDTLNQVFQFLDIANLTSQQIDVYKKTRFNHRAMPDEGKGAEFVNKTRRLLDDFFRPVNKKLAGLLLDPKFLWGT